MKKKNYYYVIVYHANKLKFVTSIDRENKTAKWEMKQDAKPYELTTLPYYEKENK